MTATTENFTSIPLNKLIPWKGNVRKTGAGERIEELAADIAAHGLLNPLLIRKAARGRFAVVAGGRRHRALSFLADAGKVEPTYPVPCHMIAASADATEISLAENVTQAPMHPADQFEAFRALIDSGQTPEDIASRFGITEEAVKKRLRLARVSPEVLEAYRNGQLTLEQVQAFAVTDDAEAQDRVLGGLAETDDSPRFIRRALTEHDIAGTDKRARFVGVAAYEAAGGPVRRDLFTEGDSGVFLLDPQLLDRLAREKLETAAEAVRAEGWKWVDFALDFDYAQRSQFRRVHAEPVPLSEEAEAEHRQLAEEYEQLFNGMEEGDEEASLRLDAIQARVGELEATGRAYTPEAFAIAGAVVTINGNGEAEIVRGLVRPEDAPEHNEATPEETETPEASAPEAKPPFSAALMESLTSVKSATVSAALIEQPDIALAAVTHALAANVFLLLGNDSSLLLKANSATLRGSCNGKEALEQAREAWRGRLPSEPGALWGWCLAQDRDTLLRLLAFCAAHAVDAVERKGDRPNSRRLAHANALAAALKLDMAHWFTPTAENYFSRVGRTQILSDLAEATGAPAKRSWAKLTKAALSALAEREVGAGWLPQPLRLP
jgi:ParB family chromosome partitioning protein